MDYPAAKIYILNRLERELAPDLYYHGMHHTLDVLYATVQLCWAESINQRDTQLLKTAALYHDCGFLTNNINHEKLGCDIARQNLHRFGYTPEEIELICGMIMATKIPQSPKTHLEEILCDADLDYLGRDDFQTIGNSLFEELKAYRVLTTRSEWNRMQIGFLEKHAFFTEASKSWRRAQKLAYLAELKERVGLI